MASKGIKFAGFELSVVVNKDAVTVRGSVRNGLWREFYRWLRGLLGGGEQKDTTQTTPAQPTQAADESPQQRELREQIAATNWYHTIDLGHGVITPGKFDHRPNLPAYQLPASLEGKRVLDVATFDGFWAFELERRGAKEVVAIDVERFGDIDFSPSRRATFTQEQLDQKLNRGFGIAHKALGSRVKRENINVYDLSPDALGKFDIVHIGDVLLHLRHPLKALENVLSVTGGYALISDCYVPDLGHLGMERLVQYHGGRGDSDVWWWCGLDALEQMIRGVGFNKVELLSTFRYGTRSGSDTLFHAVFRASP